MAPTTLNIYFHPNVTSKYSVAYDRSAVVNPDSNSDTHPLLCGWKGFLEVSLMRHHIFSDSVPYTLIAAMYSAGCTVEQAVKQVLFLADVTK